MPKINWKYSKILTGVTVIVIAVGITLFYSRHGKTSESVVPVMAEQPLDQSSADQVMALDKQNQHATFVFVDKFPGISKMHNRVVLLPPISDELRINVDEYLHKGHDGALYIVLPESYAGPKEKLILKSFPDYKGWYASMLSDNFVMYAAK